MKVVERVLLSAVAVLSLEAMAVAQGQQPQGRGPAPRLVLSVTSNAWPDGGEVPMHNAGRGDNKSPAFEFHWTLAGKEAAAPEGLKTYAVIFHDIENSTNKTTVDTLHWSAFNIPGSAKGLPEGLGTGDLADGTRNGPGILGRGGNPGGYFGPGAGPGPFGITNPVGSCVRLWRYFIYCRRQSNGDRYRIHDYR